MPRRRQPMMTLLLLVLVAFGANLAVLFRQGLVPPAVNPLPALDLATPDPWFLDWRLAALRHDPGLCRHVLTSPTIVAEALPDSPLKAGCGWNNAVRVSNVNGIRAGFDPATCEAAAALALWLSHDVAPLAEQMFGERLVSIQSFGSYACRNIVGNPLWKAIRSEHATANALDISAFTLAGGRRISVAKHWKGASVEAQFLRAAHASACRYFRVVLGPDYNEAHHNHFHLDRGLLGQCK